MKPKKKYFLLIVRRSAGEIDWILPLIYKLKKDTELITLFSNQKCLESLNSNKTLYKLWKKKCNKFYVIKKTDRFIYKILIKLFYFLRLKELKFFTKLENFFLKKTFDFNKLINQFKIDKNAIKVILTPINNLSSLSLIFKINIPNIKLVRFPESQWINPSRKYEKINNLSRRIYADKFTDFYLINKIQNINFFLGNKINFDTKKKIIYCKFFKYEKWWINKIVTSTKTDKQLITVFTRPPDNVTLSTESYRYYILTILKLLKDIENIKIVFKIHTMSYEKKLINKILKNFKTINWRIESNHAMLCAAKSNFCISILTSACLDCLAVNKKVIEFFDYCREKNKAGGVYIKNKKKWISIYSKKKLVANVDDEKKLKLRIKNIFLNKGIPIFNLNKKNFKNLNLSGLDSNIVLKKITKLTQS